MEKYFLTVRKSKPYHFLKDRFLYYRSYIRYRLHPYSKEIGDDPIFIFNHIPKSGGVSLLYLFRSWFYVIRDYAPSEKILDKKLLEEMNIKFCDNIPQLNKIEPWCILSGHYHLDRFSLNKRIPEIYSNPRVKAITFLRDPLKQRVSLYYYAKKQGDPFVQLLNLQDYLNCETNYIATSLNCNLENYTSVLDSYFFIGLLEYYNESISELAKKIGRKENYTIPKLNVNKSSKGLEELPEEEINTFKEKNSLDYLIYDYAFKKTF